MVIDGFYLDLRKNVGYALNNHKKNLGLSVLNQIAIEWMHNWLKNPLVNR